jgi:aldehyde:ferredoxin oxidoreductase
MINAHCGTEWTPEEYQEALGIATLRREREFNRRAGFGPADDRLPDFMAREALPPHNTVFDVPAKDLDKVHANL